MAFVRGIHRWPENFQHKGPVALKMFTFDDNIMKLEVSIVINTGIMDDGGETFRYVKCNIMPGDMDEGIHV